MPPQTPSSKRIPVSVITGFLGSGKTTLLNHILTAQHGQRIAVIENEFGEVGIDDKLVKNNKFKEEEEIFVMNNGCICCTVRGDLIRILNKLAERKDQFDAVLIETTGLADPAPVAQTFFVDDDLAKVYELDGIITVVDCKHLLLHLDEVKAEGIENESVEQIAFADVILVNKTDLVSKEQAEIVKERIRMVNSMATQIESVNSVVDPALLLNIKAFDLKRILRMDPAFLADQEHQHDKSVSSVGFIIGGDLVVELFQAWIATVLDELGPNLFRYKGVLSMAGMQKRYVFQGVHMLYAATFDTPWNPQQVRDNRFIFIGRNLDREFLREGFESCLAKPLRFKLDDEVLYKGDGGKYLPGLITRLWDDGNAYRIRSTINKDEVWAPVDDDNFVKARPASTMKKATTGFAEQGAKKKRT